MTGTIRGGDGDFTGTGTSSPLGGWCGHDETELRAAATQLGRAQDEVRDARAAVARAEEAAWQGQAAESFRRSTASLGAKLGALAAVLGTLGLVVAALQSEAAGCTGAAPGIGASTPPGGAAPRGLVVEGRRGAIAPLASREPALRLPAPSGPVFARGLAGAHPEEGCR